MMRARKSKPSSYLALIALSLAAVAVHGCSGDASDERGDVGARNGGAAGTHSGAAGEKGDAGGVLSGGGAGQGASGAAGQMDGSLAGESAEGGASQRPSFETFSAYIVIGLSSDGTTAIGAQGADPAEPNADQAVAIRFAHGTGVQPLESPAGFPYCAPSALSADGFVVVGACGIDSTPLGMTTSSATLDSVATVWDASGSPKTLGRLAQDDISAAWFVSQGGSIVLGRSVSFQDVAPALKYHAFIWSQPTGLVSLSSEVGLNPVALSGDGKVALAQAAPATGSADLGYLWNNRGSSSTFQQLYPLPGDVGTVAVALSGDGNVAVGFSVSDDGSTHAVRWASAGAPELLVASWQCPNLPNLLSPCLKPNFDGSVIYGVASNLHAARWTASSGGVTFDNAARAVSCEVFESPYAEATSAASLGDCSAAPYPVVWQGPGTPTPLADVFAEAGVDAQGLFDAPSLPVGISASGLVLLGAGHGGGWIVRLP